MIHIYMYIDKDKLSKLFSFLDFLEILKGICKSEKYIIKILFFFLLKKLYK